MFNNIRYNNWVKKINRLQKQQKMLSYTDRVKIFAQTRAGKLSRAQCDELINMVYEVIADITKKGQIQSIVSAVLNDNYTVDNWYVKENELVIEVKESEKVIRLHTAEGKTMLVKYRIELNGKECKVGNYYGMTIDEFVDLLKDCENG